MKKTTLKKNISTPLYKQLVNRIRQEIEAGNYSVGSRIPTEQEIIEKYGVSRITVRKAVSVLTEEGLLVKKQGQGTFVSAPKLKKAIHEVNSFHQNCRRLGVKAETRVVSVKEITGDENDCKELEVKAGSKLIKTVRVRFADKRPVVFEINHFSSAYSFLKDMDLTGSLYGNLAEIDVYPSAATHEISMVPANKELAEALEIPLNTALIYLKEVIYDQHGRPLHNSKQYIRGDKFVFTI